MSQVILFKEITTEEALTAIEEEASSYEGLHVEMDDPEQRKFVKGKLSQITDITKKIERARIDLATAHKNGLNNEAGAIIKRLEDASKPFTDLTDAWKIKRQKILDHKKAQEAEAQKIIDHENAIMENKVRDMEARELADKLAAEKEQERLNAIAENERLAKEAAEKAEIKAKQDLIDAENKRVYDLNQAEIKAAKDKQDAIDLAAKIERDRVQAEQKAAQDLVDAENKRLADIERTKQESLAEQKAEAQRIADETAKREANPAHVVSICKAAKESLMQQAGLTEAQAIDTVKAIRSELILNVAIKF